MLPVPATLALVRAPPVENCRRPRLLPLLPMTMLPLKVTKSAVFSTCRFEPEACVMLPELPAVALPVVALPFRPLVMTPPVTDVLPFIAPANRFFTFRLPRIRFHVLANVFVEVPATAVPATAVRLPVDVPLTVRLRAE